VSFDRDRVADWITARMTATGTLRRPNTVDRDRDATVDPETLAVTPAAPAEIYSGLAAVGPVHERGQGGTDATGRRDGAVHVVLSFPPAVDARPGDVFTVETHPDDAFLVGRSFTVDRVRESSRRVRVVCEATDARS
jgi:hypothetical protein